MISTREKQMQRSNNIACRPPSIFTIKFMSEIPSKIHLKPAILSKINWKSTTKQSIPYKQSTKINASSSAKQGSRSKLKKEKKSDTARYDDDGLKYFEAIVNSTLYQQFNSQFAKLKLQQEAVKQELKKQISSINKQINTHKGRSGELNSLRNNLIEEVNHLSRHFNNIQLQNYERRCDLLARRGVGGQLYFYDSEPEITFDQLEYEDMLQLQQRLGYVQTGYKDQKLEQIQAQNYDKNTYEQDKCCICYSEFQEGDEIFSTNCLHIHHKECIKKWLKVKKFCPLCRQEIVLT